MNTSILKWETEIDTSEFAEKFHLATLKSDKMNNGSTKTVPVDLSKLSEAVNIRCFKDCIC